MKKAYWELLRDPRWQKKRLEIMEREKFACEECSATDKTLNVHHKIYRKGAMPWEYDGNDLACLCEDCHLTVTETTQQLKELLAMLDVSQIEQVTGYVKGLVHLTRWTWGDEPSPEPGFVSGACDFEGIRDALNLNLLNCGNIWDLLSRETSELDLMKAYRYACQKTTHLVSLESSAVSRDDTAEDARRGSQSVRDLEPNDSTTRAIS